MSRSVKNSKKIIFKGKIDKLVYGGFGITDCNGLKVFVPYAALSDELELVLTEEKKHYGVAKINKIITPSPLRIEPQCPYFTKCGGCDWQHITYEGQLTIKKDIVKEILMRHGQINWHGTFSIIPSIPFRYRNKSQFPLSEAPPKIGYYARKTHDVVDIEICLLHLPVFDQILKKIKKSIFKSQEPIYNEKEHSGNLRHVILRGGINTNEILIIFVTRTHKLSPRIYKELPDEFSNIVGINQNINPDRTNRILGSQTKILYGQEFYYEKILNWTFRISATSFFQINTYQLANLINILRSYLTDATNILDLYCGVGVLSIAISDKAKRIWGIEINSEAIADARTNAQLNNVNNIEFIAQDVKNVISDFKDIDTVIIDPPRKGCEKTVLEKIVQLRPTTIIYISCNPTTFTRDLVFLSKYHYQLSNCTLVDMFPQTYHIELIAQIVRNV
ncbi:MAG: 23S rRNA (uracil(1939)-C(5))-methyltransferase RlmD [candidate division WOR-3 bacterium]|nr:23S rRNA (uracil(1939)-C(5))-methyltransferase RlmD [candidate division WOR-3 bacterium]MDW7988116.1 23S rRNA (uracil(1939)-C(5))-methyltransferase RlmD [candidate division WOR-3 bacterium]